MRSIGTWPDITYLLISYVSTLNKRFLDRKDEILNMKSARLIAKFLPLLFSIGTFAFLPPSLLKSLPPKPRHQPLDAGA